MAKINKLMTYNVPNEYLSQDMSDGNIATNDYNGPDTIWINVYKDGDDKGLWTRQPIKTNYLDDGDIEDYENDDQTDAIEALPVPEDAVRVRIDCTETPEICAIWTGGMTVGDDSGSYEKLPQIQDKLADGTVYYERPANDSIPPDHVWSNVKSKYNLDTEEWELVLLSTWSSWDLIRETRNSMLEHSDSKTLMPAGALKDKWDTFRQDLRDLPEKFAGKEPHTVPLPIAPDEKSATQSKDADGNEEAND